MEEPFMKTALPPQDYQDLVNTSLALPDQPALRSTIRNESGGKSMRVYQQVQLTMSRKAKKSLSNGGAHFQINTGNSFDGVGGFSPYTKANGFDFSSQSLTNGQTRKPPRRVEVSPPASVDLPFNQLRYSTYRQGFESTPAPQSARTLIQHSRGLDSYQRRTFSGALQGPYMNTSTGSALRSFNHKFHKLPSRQEFVLTTPPLHQNAKYDSSWRHKQSTMKQERPIFQRHNSASFKASQPDQCLSSWLAQDRRDGQRSMRQTSYPPSVNSVETDTGRKVMAEVPTRQINVENVPVLGAGVRAPEMTLEKALSLLTTKDEEKLISAINHIQSECLQKDSARQKVLGQGGIEKLLQLLENGSEEVQRAAAGALRNVVYKSNENKEKVKEKDGMNLIVDTLASSQDKETRRQLTGVLWNLSSHDLLKELFRKDAIRVLTKYVLVPSSGLSQDENPKDEMLADADSFYNATGCLRNLSSAGPNVRKTMRDCENLIDSLVYYIRGSVPNSQTDDKSTENCVCILNNLTYQAKSDVLHSPTQPLRASQQNLATESTSVGCFPYRSAKITQAHREHELPLQEEKANPQGTEWLWSAITMRMYLSLVACSKSTLTQEAAVGALQNISGNKFECKHNISTIFKKENGLQHIQEVLQNGDSKVKIKAILLIRNLSRYQELHSSIVEQVLSDVVAILNDDKNSGHPNDVTAALLHILFHLSQNNLENAKVIIDLGALPKILKLSKSKIVQVEQAADVLLHILWRHKDLHQLFERQGYGKYDFVNAKITKSVKSLKK